MGINEEEKSAKAEKSPSPIATDQPNQNNQAVHVYPDWAAMQAYYGPRVALPPYYNSAVASGHAPHPYMWGPPQPMMPPYGAPYAAIYSHGGVYTHPGNPLGAYSHAQAVSSSPVAATPLSFETPTKSSGNTDHGLLKKLKGFDGLAMSIGNGNSESAEGGADNRPSESEEDTEGSSDGSDGSYGNTAGAKQTRRKRSHEGTPTIGAVGKSEVQGSSGSVKEAASSKLAVTPASVAGKLAGAVISPGMNTALELRNPPTVNVKTCPTSAGPSCGVLPSDAWIQNERELKRERRKQSNRESARRSRLRKQAEAEELGRKVEFLNGDNMTLKSEINRLTESSQKLRVENATLMARLKNAQLGQTEDIILNSTDKKRAAPVSTENLLSRVNNPNSDDRKAGEGRDMFDKKPNSGAKLHQLLDANPRADAVAAG